MCHQKQETAFLSCKCDCKVQDSRNSEPKDPPITASGNAPTLTLWRCNMQRTVWWKCMDAGRKRNESEGVIPVSFNYYWCLLIAIMSKASPNIWPQAPCSSAAGPWLPFYICWLDHHSKRNVWSLCRVSLARVPKTQERFDLTSALSECRCLSAYTKHVESEKKDSQESAWSNCYQLLHPRPQHPHHEV